MKLLLLPFAFIVYTCVMCYVYFDHLEKARAAGFQSGVESQSGAYDAGFRAGRSSAYRDLLNSLVKTNR